MSTTDLSLYPQVSRTVDVDIANSGDGYSSTIYLPLCPETKQDQHEKFPDNTGSVEDNLFSEEPTMGLRRSTRIRRAPDRFGNGLFKSYNKLP